ncbi:MAG: amino acid adenylation domain-containing protein [Marinosulfonomonas sp.]
MNKASEILLPTVYDQFKDTAANVPNSIAVMDKSGTHSYAFVRELVQLFQLALEKRGIGGGDLVGVLLERTVNLPSALLAIFGAGAAYLPLDNGDPAERHFRNLTLCPCKIVLGNRALLGSLKAKFAEVNPDNAPEFMAVEDLGDFEPIGETAGHAVPNNLAYILLTSGSTGEPKAVDVIHRNVSALLKSASKLLNFTAEDRYLATSPLTFDASITEIFLPLISGATIVLEERDLVLDPKAFAQKISSNGVTIAQTTPSTWAAILTSIETIPPLRILITHGEAVSPQFAKTLSTMAEKVLNIYGPTETTVWATAQELTANMPTGISKGSAPIGKLLSHFVALVIDEEGRPTQAGIPGELCLGGPSVTQGYRNDANRTSAAFFEREGVRFYKTGDLVQQDANGVIHYLGRIDDQMSINGLRIEPGEIEAAILEHPWIAQVTVTWYPVSSDQRAIVAVVVPAEGHSINASGIRMFLAAKLGRAMLPSRYLIVSDLPTLSSGKVDKSAIRNIAVARKTEDEDETLNFHMNETENTVAKIWSTLLKIETVRRDDEFFLIGGDSLAAVEMISKIEAALGFEVSITEIFENPVLHEFAASLDHLSARDDGNEPMQPGTIIRSRLDDKRTPLFFALADYDYSSRAGREIPCKFYNLTVWNRDDGIIKMRRLQSFASRYIEEIRAEQPEGPYRLAGYSVGGLLIFEVAHQMIAAGDEIASIFLLDPTPPTKFDFGANSSKRGAIERLVSETKRILNRLPGDIKNLTFWRDYRIVNKALTTRLGHTKGEDIDASRRDRAMRFVIGRMAARYTATPLNFPMTLVTTDIETENVWKTLAGDALNTHRLETDHRGVFMQPYDKVWTKILINLLDADKAD